MKTCAAAFPFSGQLSTSYELLFTAVTILTLFSSIPIYIFYKDPSGFEKLIIIILTSIKNVLKTRKRLIFKNIQFFYRKTASSQILTLRKLLEFMLHIRTPPYTWRQHWFHTHRVTPRLRSLLDHSLRWPIVSSVTPIGISFLQGCSIIFSPVSFQHLISAHSIPP